MAGTILCKAVADVRRAAPVDGFYAIEVPAQWGFPEPWKFTIARRTDCPGKICKPWKVWGDEYFRADRALIGFRIGPRIIMPGEGR